MADHEPNRSTVRTTAVLLRQRHALPALAAIALTVLVLAAAFAWVGGWLTPGKLTPARFTDDIETANGQVFPGFRRAHAKGICVSGWFEGSPEGRKLSRAPMFDQPRTTLTGRMSIGGGTPYGLDPKARVRSMALRLIADDGQEWRMAMNSFPFFSAATVADFNAQTLAGAPDPITGKPDPEKMAAFRAAHPAAQRFAAWAASAPWSTSFANTTYNGVNTFRFIDSTGEAHHVRWSMLPQTPFEAMPTADRETADANFLSADLNQRVSDGPLRWNMIVTLAEPGDPIEDPSQPWPAQRHEVNVGTVVINQTQPQASGPCRDINFDPLILPTGVEGADPVLAARSAIYAVSFDRRERETAFGAGTEETAAQTGRTP